MEELIAEFAKKVRCGEIEIYNEFSLQHELGIFLRDKLRDSKIQFERHVCDLNLNYTNHPKREIDIVILSNNNRTPVCAIELKFPKNKRTPLTMFDYCKDISFMECLRRDGFKEACAIIFADDHDFYKDSGRRNIHNIYDYFRLGKRLEGRIFASAKHDADSVDIKGPYKIEWLPVTDKLKYAIVKAQ